MTMLLVTLPLMVLGVAVAVIPLVLAIARESQARTLQPLAAFGHERAERQAEREHLAA